MNKKIPFYLFVIGVFLILISPTILSVGMFIDGLVYSTIANNLASGIGTFWNPHYTATCMADFHGHPPLAIGLHSIFYIIFGSSRYIDKLYSLLTFVIVGIIIVKIWKHLAFKNAWLPLFIWFLIPLVSWAICNNMLENTLSIFTSLSVLFYFKSQDKNKYLYIFFAGIMIALGFLSKGFVAFFPWTFPFLLWLFKRKETFLSTTLSTIAFFLFSIVPLLILVILWPEAKISLQTYVDTQVIHSLKNAATVDSRFFIIMRLFAELIPAIGLCVIFMFWGWRKKFTMKLLKTNLKTAALFFTLGLTGVIPIMISMKQSGFYIIATFPFFAIAIAVIILPLIEFLFSNEFYKTKGFSFFKWISFVIFICGIALSVYFSNRVGRDKNKIQDMYIITEAIPAGTTINILPSMREDWSLHGYYSRHKHISLDTKLENEREFLLVESILFSDTAIMQNYVKIELQTTDFQLYRKANKH